MPDEKVQPSPMSIRQQLDMHLNDINSGYTKYVNLTLVILIMLSVFCSMLSTVKTLPAEYYNYIHITEYLFMSIFSVEYALRVYSAPNRMSYIFSAYGIIDLAAVLPVFFIGGNESFALRLIRTVALFRMLKLLRYAQDVQVLLQSLSQSLMILFMLVTGIILLAIMGGNIIYLLEPENFKSAFDGAWWSLVTMSTVGYGDYVPHTLLGRIVAGGAMVIGIGLFAIVTGLISSRIIEAMRAYERCNCRSCNYSVERKSLYCSHCGIRDPIDDYGDKGISPVSTDIL